MQQFERLPHEDKVIMEAPAGDERVLVATDQAIQSGGKPQRQDLGEYLGHDMGQADRAVVAELLGVGALGQKGHEGLV